MNNVSWYLTPEQKESLKGFCLKGKENELITYVETIMFKVFDKEYTRGYENGIQHMKDLEDESKQRGKYE